MASAEEGGLSKSARKRANQKAREAEGTQEAAPAPAPKPAAAKPKAKAEPAPAAPKAEAKAKAKSKAAAPEAAPKAEPKAKAKAKAKAEAAPEAKPAAKAEAKAEAKAKPKAKPKAKKEEQVAPKPKPAESEIPMEIDDGKGGDWEVASALDKKRQKQKDRQDVKKAEEEAAKKAADKAANGKSEEAVQTKGKAKNKNEPSAAAKAAAAKEPVLGVSPAVLAAKEAAEKVAAAKAEEAAAAKAEAEANDPNITATVKVDSSKIGRVIGPKGATIALIKEKTGVKSIDTAGDLCTIVGLPDTVPAAENAIRELMEKGYMSIAFEDFQEDGVQVLPSSFPDIIGKQGAIIQAIKKEAKVEIDIPSVPKNGPAGKKYKVSIAGSKAGVELAKEIVNSIVLYSHHEVTHPGFTHAEIDVEEWKYKFLIGKGGSEMRHIQNNYKVKVNIPRETSASDKVVVVGELSDVERCVKYIEKILKEAEEPKGRAAPEKSEDTWGDEGPQEAWMDAYMYKRR